MINVTSSRFIDARWGLSIFLGQEEDIGLESGGGSSAGGSNRSIECCHASTRAK